MTQLTIEFFEDRTEFKPGEPVELTLSWDLVKPPEKVELRLCWNTAGKGTTDLAVIETIPFEFPGTVETRRTTVTLPRSPYSFSGRLVSLVWAFELIVFPSEVSTRREITLAPGGREVRLSSVSTDEFDDALD